MDKKPTPQQKYETKRFVKRVSFNLENERDILEFSKKLDFSNWVKKKLRHEMELEKFRKD